MKHSVRYNLAKPPLADGRNTIRLAVSWNGSRFFWFTPEAILEKDWDADALCARTSCKQHLRINRSLARITASVEELFTRCELDRITPTPDLLRGMLTGTKQKTSQEPTVVEAFTRFIDSSSKMQGWEERTIKNLQGMVNKWAAFDPTLHLDELTEEKMQGFIDMLFKQGLRNTTVTRMLRLTRWAGRWCLEEGLTKTDDFNKFRPKLKGDTGQVQEIVYLTTDELRRLYGCDYSATIAAGASSEWGASSLDKVRDVFLFCCFTGLRWSDAFALRHSDVHQDYIFVTTEKTDDPLKIELNSYSRAILEKYADNPRTALPVVSNQKMNNILKDCARLAGIDEPMRRIHFVKTKRVEEVVPKWQVVTSHCARRTFVVSSLLLGIPAEVIMKWTGHVSYETMKPYVAIVDKLKETEMSKFNNLLSM